MMNWRRPVIQLLLRLTGRRVMKYYHWMNQVAFWSPEELATLREKKLKDLLQFAWRNVLYYQEIFKKYGLFDERGEFHRAQFEQLPLLDKQILRERFEDLRTKPPPKGRRPFQETSGGSTGEPVKFLQDNISWDWTVAATLFFTKMAGKEVGEREVKLWGSERDILQGSIGLDASLQNYLYNRLLLNSFRMTPQQMRDYVSQINRLRPKTIWCYVDSIYELARLVEKERLDFVPPKAIIVTAGTLYEEVRKYIQRVLQTPVLNQYGSREVGGIACECHRQKGLHIFDFNHYVEIINADGRPAADGELGEVVTTSFNNLTMPLIRFRIGDVAIKTTRRCDCGRGLSLLEKVTGRVTDHFVCRDGTLVHGEYFTHLFYHRPQIAKFKVIQENYDHIQIKIVLAPGYSRDNLKADCREINDKIKRVMGPECKVEFEFVDFLPESGSGKYRYTESRVKSL